MIVQITAPYSHFYGMKGEIQRINYSKKKKPESDIIRIKLENGREIPVTWEEVEKKGVL